jgi:hypothetical protein
VCHPDLWHTSPTQPSKLLSLRGLGVRKLWSFPLPHPVISFSQSHSGVKDRTLCVLHVPSELMENSIAKHLLVLCVEGGGKSSTKPLPTHPQALWAAGTPPSNLSPGIQAPGGSRWDTRSLGQN